MTTEEKKSEKFTSDIQHALLLTKLEAQDKTIHAQMEELAEAHGLIAELEAMIESNPSILIGQETVLSELDRLATANATLRDEIRELKDELQHSKRTIRDANRITARSLKQQEMEFNEVVSQLKRTHQQELVLLKKDYNSALSEAKHDMAILKQENKARSRQFGAMTMVSPIISPRLRKRSGSASATARPRIRTPRAEEMSPETPLVSYQPDPETGMYSIGPIPETAEPQSPLVHSTELDSVEPEEARKPEATTEPVADEVEDDSSKSTQLAVEEEVEVVDEPMLHPPHGLTPSHSSMNIRSQAEAEADAGVPTPVAEGAEPEVDRSPSPIPSLTPSVEPDEPELHAQASVGRLSTVSSLKSLVGDISPRMSVEPGRDETVPVDDKPTQHSPLAGDAAGAEPEVEPEAEAVKETAPIEEPAAEPEVEEIQPAEVKPDEVKAEEPAPEEPAPEEPETAHTPGPAPPQLEPSPVNSAEVTPSFHTVDHREESVGPVGEAIAENREGDEQLAVDVPESADETATDVTISRSASVSTISGKKKHRSKSREGHVHKKDKKEKKSKDGKETKEEKKARKEKKREKKEKKSKKDKKGAVADAE
ncbi:hypothetical protein J8273_6990 [Carpediemonas membranifera]|uniref:Uncharacterized protein n=1 Tax=Carpediemonas membranifera TaxID=201153 RepID=A0A8J6B120_9EUKA|nr:hypothetical protein J8273_6990 [Carpediemonas membranifera]|eukprot:KAG9390737.1 hypothetical protein J8273_6990 [Carpediemonas membranifera]